GGGRMDELYAGREQSLAKHWILREYLKKLAFKVAQSPRFRGTPPRPLSLNYVDAFAGPWSSSTSDLRDTSPSIAIESLLSVKGTLARQGFAINVRGFFVSQTAEGVEQLRSLSGRWREAEICIARGTFASQLDAAARFARHGINPFAFWFIDPTGWTGFSMNQ